MKATSTATHILSGTFNPEYYSLQQIRHTIWDSADDDTMSPLSSVYGYTVNREDVTLIGWKEDPKYPNMQTWYATVVFTKEHDFGELHPPTEEKENA